MTANSVTHHAPLRNGAGGNAAGPAMLATAIMLSYHAATGFSTLDVPRDGDAAMRLVEVRDLIAGQGWFDLNQYRMGPDGGFLMHWSRLVDAPIAALTVLLGKASGSPAAGETAALVLWPALLFFKAMALILALSRRLGGSAAQLPALLLGGTTLHYIGIFAPGAIDHHNVQLVLALATLLLLVRAAARHGAADGMAAGAGAALLLAIALEGLPYVAAAGAVVGVMLILDRRNRDPALGFGLAFAAIGAAAFAATVPPGSWRIAQCDAYSAPQLLLAVLSGLGMAGIAWIGFASAGRRLGACLVLACLVAAALGFAFPQCLADPYAAVGERMRSWWLDSITEAQPVWRFAAANPALAAGHFVTPLIALFYAAWRLLRPGRKASADSAGGEAADSEGVRPALLVCLAMLVTAVLVSFWQVRGAMFSLPFAAPLLASMVADRRVRATERPGAAMSAAMVLAWIASINVTWSVGAGVIADTLRSEAGTAAGGTAAQYDPCTDYRTLGRLAALPPTGVLVISNLGAHVLAATPHRVLAGPYHRNVEGNLLALDAFAGAPDAALDIARQQDLTLLAFCPGNDESGFIAGRAPAGLMAMLVRGEPPAWLEPVPESIGEPLQIFRITGR